MRGERLWPLLHQQVPCIGEQLQARDPWNVQTQPLRPGRAEMGIICAPQEERRMIEATQSLQRLQGAAVVSRIELPCQESGRLGTTMSVAGVGSDVALDQF